jgi:hypothetical protein
MKHKKEEMSTSEVVNRGAYNFAITARLIKIENIYIYIYGNIHWKNILFETYFKKML